MIALAYHFVEVGHTHLTGNVFKVRIHFQIADMFAVVILALLPTGLIVFSVVITHGDNTARQ